MSDHTPLVLDSGVPSACPQRMFRFGKWWLEHPEFVDLVYQVWNTPCGLSSAIDIWQLKFRLLRRKAKGWSINVESASKRLKSDLMLEFDILDTFSEHNQLSDFEKERMSQIKKDLDRILKNEEIKAWQRSRDRIIKEGDRNTSYFHAIANQRRRKKKIVVLDGPCGPVESNSEMLKVASDFYKNLFAREEKLDISLGPHF